MVLLKFRRIVQAESGKKTMLLDKRRKNRRRRQERNLHSYLNRRDLFRMGRRKNEKAYNQVRDWFQKEESAREQSGLEKGEGATNE